MAVDERNFRSTYYEKVGFKSVEEKKSLEILLKDKTLDRIKLKQFCLRYSVPAVYRNLVWKVLLEILPVQTQCHRFVMEQRQQECKDVIQALHAMRIVDNNTPKSHLFYAMWLLQSGRLHHNTVLQKDHGFVLIAHSLQQFFDDDTDLYWLAKCLYVQTQKFTPDMTRLIEITFSLLEKEDSMLYKHLASTDILNRLPLTHWFDSCLAGVLNKTALGRIWDKICGGSCKILVFVVVVLLTNQRHRLLKISNLESSLQCVSNLSEETAEIIANKAVEMWQQHGSPLTVHDKPKPN